MVIGEDDVLLREGVARILAEAGFDVVAQAGDAADFLRKARAHKPDVAVVDVQMPPRNEDDGLRAALELRGGEPDTGVLVLSQFYEERSRSTSSASTPRASGTCSRSAWATSTRSSTPSNASRPAAPPSTPWSSAACSGAADGPLDRLTPRERDVLAAMAEGKSNRGIAASLFVTEAAVEKHVRASSTSSASGRRRTSTAVCSRC